MKNKKTDLEVLEHSFDNVLENFNDCFEIAEDDRKTKMNVVGSIFGFGVSLTKFSCNVLGCAVKNTPKAIVAVASVKREIVTELEHEYKLYQKELKEDALNEKIRQLKLKK